MQGGRLGALHGLPIAIKDLQDAEGLVNSQGSPIYRNDIRPADQALVAAMRAAGAIIVGKSNVPEFGAGANSRNRVYGATGNPFDPSKNAAGSSGGSAVALATGMVPLCSGSDTGGSLRNPAAFCGVVGVRPSPGLVPNETRPHGWSPLSVLGPMARTVADAALLLSVMQSADGRDPLAPRALPDVFPPAPVDLSRLRVAFSADLGFAPVEAHISRVFAAKTALFRHVFAEARDSAPDCAGADETFETLRSVIMLAAHAERVRDRPQDVGPLVRTNVEHAMKLSAVDVSRALSAQTAHHRRWQAFFGDADLLVTPAITVSPRPWRELYPAAIDGRPTRGYFHWLALAYAVTLAGHPAVALPVGRDEAGLPFGLQIVGRRGGDAAVLAAAAALEALLADDPRTARPAPDLAALAAAPNISASPGFLGFD
jgi:Asp-tRNA(Asn)/Glu-tRNA(Gln) amidotransferase A subunit family amidase